MVRKADEDKNDDSKLHAWEVAVIIILGGVGAFVLLNLLHINPQPLGWWSKYSLWHT